MDDITSLQKEYNHYIQKANEIKKKIITLKKTKQSTTIFKLIDNFDQWWNKVGHNTLNGNAPVAFTYNNSTQHSDTFKFILIWNNGYAKELIERNTGSNCGGPYTEYCAWYDKRYNSGARGTVISDIYHAKNYIDSYYCNPLFRPVISYKD